MRLRLWLRSMLRLLHRLLGLWKLLRWGVWSRLWLGGCYLWRRGLRRRLRRIRLRRAAPLVRSRAWLRLRGDALGFVDILRLCCGTLLRCRLAGLSSISRLLNLRLLCLLSLQGDKLLLLRCLHLRLPVGQLLKVHLLKDRSHRGISLHGRHLSRVQALRAIG
jgi:hypothetical protein